MPKKTKKTKRGKTSTSAAPTADAGALAKHPVLLDKASLAVCIVADQDEPGRYCIDHVHVEQDGTAVGTNAKLLLAVQPPDVDPNDLPAGMLKPVDVSEKGLDISASACATVAKNLKGTPFRPILGCAVVTQCDGDLVELSSTTDLKSIKREGCTTPEKPFPSWKDMVERPCQEDTEETLGPVVQIGMRLDVLEQLTKALKKITSDDRYEAFVRFTFNANQGMVLIDGKVSKDRRFIGMTWRISPKSTDISLEDLNDWQNAILDSEEEEVEDAKEDE